MRDRIAAACARAERALEEVTLVAVTKGHGAEEVERRLLSRGQSVLAENRVQEWREKHEALPSEVEWHLVGHLQRNKVKSCRTFALIHSLDSLRLAQALEADGEKHEHVFRVLIQVNVAGETAKYGVASAQVGELYERIRELPHVEVLGLMTIAPYADDPERSRGVFRALRNLRDTLSLEALSMGMSGDYEVAVEEGATLVRVGSALFADDAGPARSEGGIVRP